MQWTFQITPVVSRLMLALLVSASSSQVMAAFYVRALTAAYDQNTGFNVVDTGQIPGPRAEAESGPFFDVGSSFHARAWAQLDLLSGPSMGAYSTVDNTVPILQAFTPANAWWGVSFTVTGTPGSQVTYNVGIQLHDALSAIKYPGYPGNLGAEASADLVGNGLFSGLSIHHNSSFPTANKTVWKLVSYDVGSIVQMGALLTTSASAQGGTATADAFSTALFAIDVLTPGGGYTTENGMVFLTAFSVPEPETYALLLTGLLLLGFVAQRKKQISV